MATERSSKRRKTAADSTTSVDTEVLDSEQQTVVTQRLPSESLNRPISPPLSSRTRSRRGAEGHTPPRADEENVKKTAPRDPPKQVDEEDVKKGEELQPETTPEEQDSKSDQYLPPQVQFLASPVQLTRIKDFHSTQNVDTVGLGDILGDPLIKEVWNFNYLFDIDFVMRHFDPDVRGLIKLRIVHGFWKREDERRHQLEGDAERYPNVGLVQAYIPDPFGTHHSKMLIIFRHDDQAQVVIHTANMIERDWGNMTQAVWRSPLLPLESLPSSPETKASSKQHRIGSGERFKVDLLRYLSAYGNRLNGVRSQLQKYDFHAIKAAFIGSAPSRQKPRDAKPASQTSWGWLGLREILSSIPVRQDNPSPEGPPHIVVQVSSIATLGATPTWLTHFQSVLSSHSKSTAMPSTSSKSSLFTTASNSHPSKATKPKLSIVFPTPSEIRASLDGYNSGASIHTKLQSAAQQKQLAYLRPLLCRWTHDRPQKALVGYLQRTQAGRGRAAPHIKTYIRFDEEMRYDNKGGRRIDWAMVTSANLSKQAWGDVENTKGEVWVQSWECGVVVWPALFSDEEDARDVIMVPVFRRDVPDIKDIETREASFGNIRKPGVKYDILREGERTVVGFRMPYDLPVWPYKEGDVPWCATAAYEEPDWKGQVWGGYGG